MHCRPADSAVLARLPVYSLHAALLAHASSSSCRKEAEPEVIYLKHVERQQQQQRKEETVSKYSAPVFMAPLKDVTVTEGERSHFEAKVGPVGDPSMVVEWYCNGSLIAASKCYILTFW